MKQEINPKDTSRAYAFEMWMKAPMPMVTFFKTLDVTRLIRVSKQTGMKFKGAKDNQNDLSKPQSFFLSLVRHLGLFAYICRANIKERYYYGTETIP